MLRSAGELTHRLARGALRAGFALKDATPYYVMFDGCRPVFLDILSFRKRDPRAETQFPNLTILGVEPAMRQPCSTPEAPVYLALTVTPVTRPPSPRRPRSPTPGRATAAVARPDAARRLRLLRHRRSAPHPRRLGSS